MFLSQFQRYGITKGDIFMIRSWTQARNLILGLFFFTLLFSGAGVVYAKNVHDMARKAESTDTVTILDPSDIPNIDVGNIFDGITNVFTDMNAYFAKRDRIAAEKEKGEAAEAKDEETKITHTKKIESGEAEPGSKPTDKKLAPYKVYTAPMIPEVGQSSQSQATQHNTWSGVDPDQPPPISGAAKQTPTKKKVVRKKRKPMRIPSIASLPKQFFPILPLGSGGKKIAQLLPVASSMPLGQDQSYIRRAVIVIHDISRNAASSMATLATLSGTDANETLIIAPQFPLDVDIRRFAKHLPDSGKQVARWKIDLGWQHGGISRLSSKARGISSFTAVDILLMFLSDQNRFPSLERVVIVGHGMGADFVQRYAAVGVAPAILEGQRLPVRFVVANASSYLYPTGVRPIQGGQRFQHPDTNACPDVDDYPYGTRSLSTYARRKGANAIQLDYPAKDITYLVGSRFVVDHYLDQSCAAVTQGANRTERGLNFSRYLTRSFSSTSHPPQIFITVPNAGYDPVALYGSYCGMTSVFGDGRCLR